MKRLWILLFFILFFCGVSFAQSNPVYPPPIPFTLYQSNGALIADTQVPIWSGSLKKWVSGYIPSAGSLTYYLQHTNSAVAGYEKLLTVPFSPHTDESYTPGNGTHVLMNYITEAGFPGLTFIPAGQYVFHIHASRVAGPFSIYAEFWETDAAGVDIAKICQTGNAVVDTTETEYQVTFTNANTYTLTSSSSRIACRVWAVTSSGATCHLYVGGTADSHMSLPSNTVDATNFVPYTGATATLDLGVHNFVTTGNVGIGTTTFGTSADRVLGLGLATAPTTSPSGVLQVYSSPLAGAGSAQLGISQEYAPYAGVAVASTTKIPVMVNGVQYYLLATTTP